MNSLWWASRVWFSGWALIGKSVALWIVWESLKV